MGNFKLEETLQPQMQLVVIASVAIGINTITLCKIYFFNYIFLVTQLLLILFMHLTFLCVNVFFLCFFVFFLWLPVYWNFVGVVSLPKNQLQAFSEWLRHSYENCYFLLKILS